MTAFKIALKASLLCIGISGCAQMMEPPPPPPPPLPPPELEAPFTPAQSKACKQKGGKMQSGGRMQSYVCVIKYTDGGKSCRDKADCQGKCIESGGAFETIGKNAVGQCQKSSEPWGCYAEIKAGVKQAWMCRD